MTLRSTIVEAARVAYLKTAGSEEVSVIVDAILDELEAHERDWAEAGAARSGFEPHTYVMGGLIAALREETE